MIETPEDFEALARMVAAMNDLDPEFAAELVADVGDTPETDPESGLIIAHDKQGKEYRLRWPTE